MFNRLFFSFRETFLSLFEPIVLIDEGIVVRDSFVDENDRDVKDILRFMTHNYFFGAFIGSFCFGYFVRTISFTFLPKGAYMVLFNFPVSELLSLTLCESILLFFVDREGVLTVLFLAGFKTLVIYYS